MSAEITTPTTPQDHWCSLSGEVVPAGITPCEVCDLWGTKEELLARFDKVQADALATLTKLAGPELAAEMMERLMQLTIDMIDKQKGQP